MIHKILKKNTQDLELMIVPLQAQNIAHYQRKHLVKMFVSLWMKMKRLLAQCNINMKNFQFSMQHQDTPQQKQLQKISSLE